jgi:hypothetical protein
MDEDAENAAHGESIASAAKTAKERRFVMMVMVYF